jgi:hypothetical protein
MDWKTEVLREIRVARVNEDSDERLAAIQSSSRMAGFYEGQAAARRQMAGRLAGLVEKADQEVDNG